MAASKKKKVAAKHQSKTKSTAKPKLKSKAKPKANVKAKAKPQTKAKPQAKNQKSTASSAKKSTSSPTQKTSPAKKSSQSLNFSQVFTPLDDRILVDVLPAETKTAGGLFIPDVAQNRQSRGLVVAVGPGKRNKKAQIRPMDVQKGDQIIYSQHAGTAIEVLGHEVLILREEEVLAIVNK